VGLLASDFGLGCWLPTAVSGWMPLGSGILRLEKEKNGKGGVNRMMLSISVRKLNVH
jgi:hypothetical protein